MPSFEQDPGDDRRTAAEDGNVPSDDVYTKAADPVTAQETPTSAAARMLEVAGLIADRLVTDARTEAESLLSAARTMADGILEASRNEANQPRTT